MSSAAAKQRDYRERLKAGRSVFAVEIDQVATCEALIAARLLKRSQIEDHDAVAVAIGRLLEIFVEENSK